jgi:DNA-binding CsgD family transcriptional regulator
MRLFIIIFFAVCFKAKAQSGNLKPLVEAWMISDTSQTHHAEFTYARLKNKQTAKDYRLVLTQLYAYLQKHPNPRLEARIYMYDVLGKREFGLAISDADRLKLQQAIKIAKLLDDEQLTAEIYPLYAEVSPPDYLLYSLKTLTLQQKIGFSHFEFVNARFFAVSAALYRIADYRLSIYYGLQCLRLKHPGTQKADPRTRILQYDILGASYIKLKQYDSAKYYYRQLLDTLYNKPNENPTMQKNWMGVAKGNIGRILALQGDEKAATPLITEYLQTSKAFGLWENAAIAQNALAAIWLKNKNYSAALQGFKRAYNWAAKSTAPENSDIASKGMADSWRLIGKPDSAYHYYELYHQYKDSVNAMLNNSSLSVVKSKMAFDTLQNNLENTNIILKQTRVKRNFVLASLILLTVITVLFYNRKILLQKHRAQMIESKRIEAETEANQAKIQIALFTKYIIEKNDLIDELNARLLRSNIVGFNHNITESLLQYPLITDDEWEKFRQGFSNAYPGFLRALKLNTTHITPAEERLAALLYLQLTPYQIANTLGISKQSVAKGKYRLKQRLNLPAETTLEQYLLAVIA